MELRHVYKGHQEELPDILGVVRTYGLDAGIEDERLVGLELAVDEVFSNIIRHGYNNKGGQIELLIMEGADNLSFCIVDQAPPFDLTQAHLPDIEDRLAQRRPGGFGLPLIRHFADDIDYQRTLEGANSLTLHFNKKSIATV